MPRIPPLNTLRVEDFDAEQRAWLPRLFLPLNAFLTAVSGALSGRIEFVSNIPAQDHQLSFQYNGRAQTVRWTLAMSPRILWVGQATEAGLAVTLFPEWSYDSSTQNVSVDFKKLNASALSIGTQYSVFIRVVP